MVETPDEKLKSLLLKAFDRAVAYASIYYAAIEASNSLTVHEQFGDIGQGRATLQHLYPVVELADNEDVKKQVISDSVDEWSERGDDLEEYLEVYEDALLQLQDMANHQKGLGHVDFILKTLSIGYEPASKPKFN